MVASEEPSPEELLEEALKKTGPDLFKELYRLYPEAEAEDYYKNGVWKNEIMKTDIVLLTRHREEAGAKDPPPLQDIKVPRMPEEQKAWAPPGAGAWAPGAGSWTAGIKPAGAITPAGAPHSGTTANAAAGGTVAELRLIALFVAKWKLDPTKTKEKLAKLTPDRRRFVVTNFKTDKTGPEATDALEKFLAEKEKDGKWDGDKEGKSSLVAGNVIAPKVGPGKIVPKLTLGKAPAIKASAFKAPDAKSAAAKSPAAKAAAAKAALAAAKANAAKAKAPAAKVAAAKAPASKAPASKAPASKAAGTAAATAAGGVKRPLGATTWGATDGNASKSPKATPAGPKLGIGAKAGNTPKIVPKVGNTPKAGVQPKAWQSGPKTVPAKPPAFGLGARPAVRPPAKAKSWGW